MDENIQKYIDADTLDEVAENGEDARAVAHKWSELVYQKLKRDEAEIVTDKPKSLDYVEVRDGNTRFRIYGVVHGWTGGGTLTYRDFVRDSISNEKNILFEKMLGQFYLGEKGVEVPDFCMLRIPGQLFLGLKTMLLWPLFIAMAAWEMGRELLTKKEPDKIELEKVIDSICYHNIDKELRRAIGESLPTKLQIAWEMSYWRSFKRYFDSELLFAVVPRSAYIAEFARRWAKNKNCKELAIVVGDRHLTEVEHFLREPVNDEWIKRKAWLHSDSILRFGFFYNILFGIYFLFLLIGGAVGSIPWLIAILLFQIYNH